MVHGRYDTWSKALVQHFNFDTAWHRKASEVTWTQAEALNIIITVGNSKKVGAKKGISHFKINN